MPIFKQIALKNIEAGNNIRKTQSATDKADFTALKASIAAHDIWALPAVEPIGNDKYRVVAGHRRFKALCELAQKGDKITPETVYTWPVREEGEGASALEIQILENTARSAMHPADEFEAFKQLRNEGFTAKQIAKRYGLTVNKVERRLALGSLHPKLLEAFRDGKVTLDSLQSYTLTNDKERQLAVYEELATNHAQDQRWSIRNRITVGKVAANHKLVRFVGKADYVKAGGTISSDLFNEADSTIYDNADLIVELATQKLETAASQFSNSGWKEVHALLHTAYHEHEAAYTRAEPTPRELNKKEQAKLDKLLAQYEALNPDDLSQDDPDYEKAYDLNEQIEAFDQLKFHYTKEQKADLALIVSVNGDGEIFTIEGHLLDDANDDDTVDDQDSNSDDNDHDDSEGEADQNCNDGMTAALLEDLTAQQTCAMRVQIAKQPNVAIVMLTATLLKDVFTRNYTTSPIKISAHDRSVEYLLADPEECPDFVAHRELVESWKKRIENSMEEGQSFLDWLSEQSPDLVRELLALAVSMSYKDIIHKGTGQSQVEKQMAQQMGDLVSLDMQNHFSAGAVNYFGKVRKEGIFTAFEEAGVTVTPDMMKAKKSDLAQIAEYKLKKINWLPPVFREATTSPVVGFFTDKNPHSNGNIQDKVAEAVA